MNNNDRLLTKLNTVLPLLDEQQRRLYLASEAIHLGRGGKLLICNLAGISYNTLIKGIKEIESEETLSIDTPIRKKGGGRKKKTTNEAWSTIKQFIEPHTRGEPQSPLQWVSKSLRNISEALKDTGILISHRVVGEALKERGFSLKANRKTFEGKGHPDRDAQFNYINKRVEQYHKENQPVISVDAKKKELVGNFKNNGTEWSPAGSPIDVNAYDFLTDAEGVAIPYGVYDLKHNKGWVNVGITKDTAEFAVQSIKNWWYSMGIYYHNTANSLLITADGGGSNSSKAKLWKYELQEFANEIGMTIEILHFPPGTSKWNKIEHRLFSNISKNWRGRPLTSYEIIVSLIGSTKTTTGLEVECEIDKTNYETGIKISEDKMSKINITQSSFHGEWNYKISPQ